MTKKTTLRDVAKEAGVSVATASYVLNNVTNQTIPTETKKRVYEAAEKLQYVQNLTARALSLGRTNLLGVLLVGDESDLISKHISYGKFIDRLERLSLEQNYHLIVARIDPRQPNFDIILERKLDGAFVIDAAESSFYAVSEKFKFGSPVVLVDSAIADPLFRHVTPDFGQLFGIISQLCGDQPYVIAHEKYHNQTLTDSLYAASGVGSDRVYAIARDSGSLTAFAREHRNKPLVVFNEFLALHLMKDCDPSNMVVVCTSDCPDFLPRSVRRIVPMADKAKTTFELMHALLGEPFSASDRMLPFAAMDPE
ncbi:LacI family DNA-binding transcriptional regulator [Cohnella faecalis]|nr:LacI family DNA-binding transcriptional regulator [Cohnella faecalis]